MRYRLDRTARRLAGGSVLLAGSPLTLFRLSAAGQRAVDEIEGGEEPPASADPLIDRLLDTGAAHPRPVSSRFSTHDVTVVVPVRGHDAAVTVAALQDVKAVVVVDDATDPPVTMPDGVIVVRHRVRQGSGAARMTGLAEVATPLVAFVDADCVPRPGWLEPLLAHLADERVGVVAPRVVSTAPHPSAGSALARYEVTRSPLDLGRDGGRIAPTTRIPFVPAAALLARADALRQVGGFDTSMEVGEDVDLIWRMVGAGWRGRYEPRSTVAHRPRASLAGFARQRFRYGESATPLHQRHPGLVAPVVVGAWAAGGWVLVALGHPVVGIGLAAVPAAGLARRLPPLPERRRIAGCLTAVGFLRAGQQMASGLTRIWWPVSVLAAALVPRLRIPIVAAAALPALLDWMGDGPCLDPVRYLGLRLLDDVAYGAGVWWGVWAGRDVGALRPRFARQRDRSYRSDPR